MTSPTNATRPPVPYLYQQRPLQVVALQWNPTQEGFDRVAFADFLGVSREGTEWRFLGHHYVILNREAKSGDTVWPGMWITKDYTGKLSVVHDQVFQSLWEEAPNDTPPDND